MFEVADRTMADLMRVHPRHLRSVLVERDYVDPSSSARYVVTPFASELFARLGKGLEDGSTARAWRITGDYGSGKSSFVLAFAKWAAGRSHLCQTASERDPGSACNRDPSVWGEVTALVSPAELVGVAQPG